MGGWTWYVEKLLNDGHETLASLKWRLHSSEWEPAWKSDCCLSGLVYPINHHNKLDQSHINIEQPIKMVQF